MNGKPLPIFSRPDNKITFKPSRIGKRRSYRDAFGLKALAKISNQRGFALKQMS
jgi:hypothetical protein